MAKVIILQTLPAACLDSLENLERALKLLTRCQGQAADVICFPEYFPFFGEDELARAARELEAYVVAGLLEKAGGRRFNTATIFDREGNLLGRQRKHTLGLLEIRAFRVVPGKGWPIFDTDFGRLGLPVCIDFWGQPKAAQILAHHGVDLVVNPSIFPILRGHWTTGALVRAFDHYLPVVGINTAASTLELAGRSYRMQGGRSFAIQPPVSDREEDLVKLVRGWDSLQEWIVLRADEKEAILAVELNLKGVRHWRPIIQHRFGIQP